MPELKEDLSCPSKTALKRLFGKVQVAYFSMEIGIDPRIPTYSGGLGVLAGDFLRSAADLNIPIIGVTLLYKEGYFHQKLVNGEQVEEAVEWNPSDFMERLEQKVGVEIQGRTVLIETWIHILKGGCRKLPILFLNTDLPENSEFDRTLTHRLYANDDYYRLCQEVVLGVGGVRMVEALGLNPDKFHMNEGHSAILALELCKKFEGCDTLEEIRKRCVFTTHTPVPAGHDQFPKDLAVSVLGDMIPKGLEHEVFIDGKLNMTYLGLRFSEHINGVAKKHGEVSRDMFPGYQIDSITNGVHSGFWTSEPFRKVYDKCIPGWEKDPFSLRYALGIPGVVFWKAHQEAKQALMDYVNQKYGLSFDRHVFTLGFARRAATYKRGDLLFSDISHLRQISEKHKMQIIYGGKAHPRDLEGKKVIKRVSDIISGFGGDENIRAVYVEDYDIEVAKLLVSGVDLWLNTPKRPLEASGTSGMKAAHNGVPQLSVLDGWWLEGHVENVTGWSLGPHPDLAKESRNESELEDLYAKLEYIILPMYYNNLAQWTTIMRHCIAINASFFNSHRMLQQYVLNAYFK
ncbi:MAG: alpha-glucan family phosphorylase [Candidatus Aenigmatarchaeota archaeon]